VSTQPVLAALVVLAAALLAHPARAQGPAASEPASAAKKELVA